MPATGFKLIATPLVVLGLASPMLVNCNLLPKDGAFGDLADAAGGCPEFESNDISRIRIQGGAAVEAKVKGFLRASADLRKLSLEMETGLIDSCAKLGADLGMPEAELTAKPKAGEGAKKVCEAVAAKVGSMIKANANAQITVQVEPPVCSTGLDYLTKCFDDCGSPIDPGDIKASCEGGKLSGKCEGKCDGACTASVDAECKGSCHASCSGKCDAGFKGTCRGKCSGKCDGKAASGKACAGVCDGKCDAGASGTCTGGCEGKCSGTCEIKASATCSGECTGGCSVEFKEPKCTGEFRPPHVDPSCQLSCAAKAQAHATCSPASVRVTAKGTTNTDVAKLVSALQVSLPEILKLQGEIGEHAIKTAEGVGRGAVDLTSAATSAGAKALVCIKSAGSAAVEATGSIKISVSASASVGGSVKSGS